MSIALLIIAMVTLAIFAREIWRPNGMYELPFLASAVFAGWVIPQIIGLQNDDLLPAGALLATSVYSAACLGAVFLGNRLGRRPLPGFEWELDNKLLFPV